MNRMVAEDMAQIAATHSIDWEKLTGRTIFITGATGLIGRTLVGALLYVNDEKHLNLRILALVRNEEKAAAIFGRPAALKYVVGTIEELPDISAPIDYVIHGASPTASRFFTEHPVETIRVGTIGTMNVLELAREKNVKSFVYLSSMEVYGAPQTDAPIPETQGTTVDTMAVRSCYPEAKRISEALCAAYASEYGVPAAVIRLAQTFGPGIAADENRVFAEFARCAMAGKDIVLQTSGASRHCYLYTADAAAAILTVLLRGTPGEVYNAANPETYCSIAEMAKTVAENLAVSPIVVRFPPEGEHDKKYPPTHRLNLDVSKIEKLGWKPTRNLKDMYKRMTEGMEWAN